VKDIVELKIGYDGIVVAGDRQGPDYAFLREHLYLGLAADVLRGGKLVPNPYKTWPEIARGLPRGPIRVYGPPPTSGTRDAFNELAMEAGARGFPTLQRLRDADEKTFKSRAATMRRDGGWIDAGENDNAMVGTLTKTPGALGVFGYSFLTENPDKVKAATIGGVAPTPRTIADGSYPLARSLFVYVKKAHVKTTPGLQAFVAEFASDAASGRGGYLSDRGLIPLPTSQHEANKVVARTLPSMARPAA
jgi:phosphate transport system substrate-binding protein